MPSSTSVSADRHLTGLTEREKSIVAIAAIVGAILIAFQSWSDAAALHASIKLAIPLLRIGGGGAIVMVLALAIHSWDEWASAWNAMIDEIIFVLVVIGAIGLLILGNGIGLLLASIS